MKIKDILKFENVGKRYVTSLNNKIIVVEVIEYGRFIKTIDLIIINNYSCDIDFNEITDSTTDLTSE